MRLILLPMCVFPFQIEQYVKITQLINNLTGNKAPAGDLIANLPGKTTTTP